MSGLDIKKSDHKLENAEDAGHEFDALSFWLLLLFVAVFFGIAAEEARHPMFQSASHATAPMPFASSMPDVHSHTLKKDTTRAIDTQGEEIQ